jgi:hypothetical protein
MASQGRVKESRSSAAAIGSWALIEKGFTTDEI